MNFFVLADAFLARGGVFLDVGANHGLLSFGLAGRHGEQGWRFQLIRAECQTGCCYCYESFFLSLDAM